MRNKSIAVWILRASLRLALLACVATCVFHVSALGQSSDLRLDTPGQLMKPGQSVRMDVELSLVNITVTDPYGRIVTGLEAGSFRVFEDNVEQEVVTFSSEDVPISVGVILDLSGSMANKIGEAKEAAMQFFKSANPEDEFLLVTVSEHAQLNSGFTTRIEDLGNTLLSGSAKGRTALLDAVYLGVSQMKNAHDAKRALLIISDGGDNNSRYNERDIRRLIREANTQLYTIGIFDPLGYRSRTPEELNGPSLLSELTELSGGRAFDVKSASELADIAAKVGMELRNQFILGYHPSNKAHDAHWRKIKVKLLTPKGLPPLTVHAKPGYYAPAH